MNQDVEVVSEQEEKCFVGNKEVPCPGSGHELNTTQQTIFWEQRLLPKGLMKDERNNMVFFSIFYQLTITFQF